MTPDLPADIQEASYELRKADAGYLPGQETETPATYRPNMKG